MKLFNKLSLSTAVVLCAVGLAGLVFAATAVDLGTAEDFAVLAGSAITDGGANTTVITGDVGLDPTGGASITGLSCSQVTGTIYDNDGLYTGGFDADTSCQVTDAVGLAAAKADLVTAYNDAAGQVTTGVITADLGGQTLTEGVYEDNDAPDSLSITGTLTLDAENNPDAVFIFKSGSTLTTAAGSEVVLINGAQACNVFWQVTSSATLGVGSLFAGNILALTTITDNGGSTVDGRLLARNGAVTLDDSTVTVPTTCLTSPTLTVTKVVINDDDGDSVVGDFTLLLNGVAITSGVATSTPTGAFTVTESGPDGYEGTFSGDCNADGEITMVAGETYTCTLTNNDEETSSGGGGGSSRRRTSDSATLRVIKQVVNNNGGTATSSDFTVFVKEDGDNVSGSPEDGATAPGTLYRLSAGTYVVSENADARYTQRFSGDCSASGVVTLSEGDTKTCTITNDDISAAVIPGFPNTGFPSKGNTAWLLVIGVLVLTPIVFYVIRKKRIV